MSYIPLKIKKKKKKFQFKNQGKIKNIKKNKIQRKIK
jgi:hypothetical protein